MIPSISTALIGFAAVLVAAGCGGPAAAPDASELDLAVSSHREVEVRWEREWDAAFQRAEDEGKPVLVNFYADWCVWCKHLESSTFPDAKVAELLSGRVVPLMVDIDGDSKELIREHHVEAPPTIVLFDAGGRELGRIPGYMPPTGFLRALEGILGAPAQGS